MRRIFTEPDRNIDSMPARKKLWLHGLLADLGMAAHTHQIKLTARAARNPPSYVIANHARALQALQDNMWQGGR